MRELTGAVYLIGVRICLSNLNMLITKRPHSYVLCSGSGILGVSIGLNALSTHASCTVWWSLIATIVVAACASVRRFHQIG